MLLGFIEHFYLSDVLSAAVQFPWTAVFACSLVAGAVDDTSERVNTALWIFGFGILLLITQSAFFVYRAWTNKQKSHPVFWATLALSLLVIPIVFLLIAMSAGTACGFGAAKAAAFLPTFELLGLVAQLVAALFERKPVNLSLGQ